MAREPGEAPAWRKVINFLCGIGSSGGDRQVTDNVTALCIQCVPLKVDEKLTHYDRTHLSLGGP